MAHFLVVVGYLARLATAVEDRLTAAGNAHPPKLVPPKSVAVAWKPVRIGTFDLGAPLVAMIGADLDGDHRSAELYAISSREVIAYSIAGNKLTELARAALAGDPAVPRSRDVFGMARVDGASLIATVSSIQAPMRVRWNAKQLVVEPAPGVDPTCAGPTVTLVPGRNQLAGGIYAAQCRDFIDATGAPASAKSTLATKDSKLTVTIGSVVHDFTLVGVTYEMVDVDRDGRLEVIISGANPPGDVDAVKVMTFPDDKPVFRRVFTGGVVGIAAIDEGATAPVAIVAAVRLAGATRMDLWRVD